MILVASYSRIISRANFMRSEDFRMAERIDDTRLFIMFDTATNARTDQILLFHFVNKQQVALKYSLT